MLTLKSFRMPGLMLLLACAAARAEYAPTAPRTTLKDGEIGVSAPGVCAQRGATYVLTQDITSPTSGLFLAQNVTLDLNGHTLSFASGPYERVPNHGFEEGLAHWDTSQAPRAEAVETARTRPFVGKYVCRLPRGEELVSPYVTLPVARRSYYAMVGVLAKEMRVSVSVDDAQGRPVSCAFQFGTNTRQSCPEPNREPKLGGGFVFAHLHGLPAGKYRIRVKAETDCLIDEVDLQPALDVGVGIVEQVLPWAYYKCILDGDSTAFFDWHGREKEVPLVKGPGTITIMNGVIRGGAAGVRNWGIQSTAKQAKLVVKNVKFVCTGVNAFALEGGDADVLDCRIESETPFLIDRHRQADYPVSVRGAKRSVIAGNEWIGGQGGLNIDGQDAEIHHNVFRVQQTVTNHYCIGPGGDGHKIHDNVFEPQQGSGIYIGRSKGVEVHDNVFRIAASPPICEYAHTDYSVSAVRLSDYNAKPGDAKGVCAGNSVYRNKIFIAGRDYPEFRASSPTMKGYEPRAYGFFISVGGGVNRIYENEIVVEHQAPDSAMAGAYAFFIGGSDNGGEIFRNRITTNVPAFWIASSYGPAANAKIHENTVTKPAGVARAFKPVRMGCSSFTATNIEFKGNTFVNLAFGVDATDRPHTYTNN
ncbi:MAG: right-handed parallel beta-helix repeat-containing protein [Planctomycetota bacterium]|nr:right-handed parallel beta-helix repeat-containing protein [Planctomycetota bacterium]